MPWVQCTFDSNACTATVSPVCRMISRPAFLWLDDIVIFLSSKFSASKIWQTDSKSKISDNYKSKFTSVECRTRGPIRLTPSLECKAAKWTLSILASSGIFSERTVNMVSLLRCSSLRSLLLTCHRRSSTKSSATRTKSRMSGSRTPATRAPRGRISSRRPHSFPVKKITVKNERKERERERERGASCH